MTIKKVRIGYVSNAKIHESWYLIVVNIIRRLEKIYDEIEEEE